MISKRLTLTLAVTLMASYGFPQLTVDLNTITTAVPFLIINPETRGGGMGDVGAATAPDVNAMHWNPAKYAFAPDNASIGISYTPWLRALVPDISLAYLSGYKRLNRMSTIAGAVRYFSLGEIQFTDQTGQPTVQFRPNEFTTDLAYSRKLSPRFSGGIALRYIHSNLTGGQTVNNANSKPGRTIASDVSVYYQNDDGTLFSKDITWALGLNISNIGGKISYTNTTKRDYLPINLRLGPRITFNLDDYNKLSFALDFNKYLVPSPPVYATNDDGVPITDGDGNLEIASGLDPDRPVASGMFSSFYDAPGEVTRIADGSTSGTYTVKNGSVFAEELREINFGLGAEYWYADQFSFRAGYFWEDISKGNRKFFTLGAGLRYTVFGLDFSYLIPAYFGRSQLVQNSPLSRTLRFTLTFNFAQKAKSSSDTPTE